MVEPNAQTQIIERDLSKLQERFDRHLEIYAQNGKELAALKQAVDALSKVIERQSTRDKEDFGAIWQQTKQNTHDISDINVTLGKLMVRVSLIAAVASSIASTAASIFAATII